MEFKLGDWVKHPHFGHGQIIEDSDSSFVIRFVTQGARKLTKEFQITPGNRPHPGFTLPEAKSIKRPTSKNLAKKQKCFTCEEIFPFIEEVMERLCQQFGGADHDAVVDALMRHPEASGIIELAVLRCPQSNKWGITSNMVQWMSQHYTEGHGDADVFSERFQRHKDSRGRWAYSLRKQALAQGTKPEASPDATPKVKSPKKGLIVANYPPSWKEIGIEVRNRSRNSNGEEQCECRGECLKHHGRCEEINGTWARHRRSKGKVKIRFTIAHLCHTPNCDDRSHLRAMCEPCHLIYDLRCRQRNLCGEDAVKWALATDTIVSLL